jgi:uncharacterized membrane protein YagU involved in acid resistance
MSAATRRRPVVKSILMCVLIAGTLDIADALLFFGYRGTPPKVLLQAIATGLIGRSALKLGLEGALLGLAIHYCITLAWATLFVIVSLSWHDLRAHPVISGLVYGLLIYAAMTYLVLPHTHAIGSRKFNPIVFANAVAALIFCMGLPIATVNRWIIGRR